MPEFIYIFYYESSEIVDHDYNGDSVYETVKNTIGAFYDYELGKKYCQTKYKYKTIYHDRMKIMDFTL